MSWPMRWAPGRIRGEVVPAVLVQLVPAVLQQGLAEPVDAPQRRRAGRGTPNS